MKTPGSSACRRIRTRSPRMAPPKTGLDGSTAATATVRPCARSAAIVASISVDFPAPGAPVKPITVARPGLATMRRWMWSAARPPVSITLMQRALAPGSPAQSRSTISALAGLFGRAASDDDKGMSKAELCAQQPGDLAMRDAGLGRRDDPLISVFACAVGGALERIERTADVRLAALVLKGLEARNVLVHAHGIRAFGLPCERRGIVVLIAIDADHLLFAALDFFLKGQCR